MFLKNHIANIVYTAILKCHDFMSVLTIEGGGVHLHRLYFTGFTVSCRLNLNKTCNGFETVV
jgi:hypothetical protein